MESSDISNIIIEKNSLNDKCKNLEKELDGFMKIEKKVEVLIEENQKLNSEVQNYKKNEE